MEKVLIFGAGGFVGPYLAREFAARGYEVYGSDRSGARFEDVFEKTYECDLLDTEGVKSIIYNVKPGFIVNLAGISSVGLSWKIPQQTLEINVCGALNILDAVRDMEQDPRILLIGSSEEYVPSESPISESQPVSANNPYGISKVTQEQFSRVYHEKYGLRIYHVRAFNHTGVGQTDSFVIPSWCKQAAEISRSGKPGVMQTGNLEIRRDFSDVRDIVRAYRMIVESEDCTEIYNVGSGRSLHLRELLEAVTGYCDQPIELTVNPKLLRPIENPTICCDHSKITRMLGWQPEHDILDTVREIYEYYREK
ncbi:MAG: GDP-mannose 4,6-dehydratase [Lachnospiraceae bacterium]|nr:GDP-mannose 4,6-dehydratase [Lachnospiraceae bacterium]